jgi:hypothetical protein
MCGSSASQPSLSQTSIALTNFLETVFTARARPKAWGAVVGYCAHSRAAPQLRRGRQIVRWRASVPATNQDDELLGEPNELGFGFRVGGDAQLCPVPFAWHERRYGAQRMLHEQLRLSVYDGRGAGGRGGGELQGRRGRLERWDIGGHWRHRD